MAAYIEPYLLTIYCLVWMAGLLIVQLVVADVVGLRKGHMPGTAVTTSHSDFHFRAVRAHANTNESLCAFIILAACAVALQADPNWTNLSAALYAGSRTLHTLVYWAGLAKIRSVAFGLSLVGLLGLLIAITLIGA